MDSDNLANGEESTSLGDSFIMIDRTSAGSKKDHLKRVSHLLDSLSDELREISLSIHDKPELQFKEYHAHKVLTDYLSNQEGWQVTPSAHDMDTAFVAVFDSEHPGPVVSFNSEYG